MTAQRPLPLKRGIRILIRLPYSVHRSAYGWIPFPVERDLALVFVAVVAGHQQDSRAVAVLREAKFAIWMRACLIEMFAIESSCDQCYHSALVSGRVYSDTQLARPSVLLGLRHALAGILKALHLYHTGPPVGLSRDLMILPPGFHSYALLPIGYPMGRFGPVRRVALADVVYEDRWGQSYRD
jgi:hypothetical protein